MHVPTKIIVISVYELMFCLFFFIFVVENSQTISSLKTLPINKGTTNEILLTPISNITIWTQTQSAGNFKCLSSLNW